MQFPAPRHGDSTGLRFLRDIRAQTCGGSLTQRCCLVPRREKLQSSSNPELPDPIERSPYRQYSRVKSAADAGSAVVLLYADVPHNRWCFVGGTVLAVVGAFALSSVVDNAICLRCCYCYHDHCCSCSYYSSRCGSFCQSLAYFANVALFRAE